MPSALPHVLRECWSTERSCSSRRNRPSWPCIRYAHQTAVSSLARRQASFVARENFRLTWGAACPTLEKGTAAGLLLHGPFPRRGGLFRHCFARSRLPPCHAQRFLEHIL